MKTKEKSTLFDTRQVSNDIWRKILIDYLEPLEVNRLAQVNKHLNGLFKTGKNLAILNKKRVSGSFSLFIGPHQTFLLAYINHAPLLLACGRNQDGQLGTGDLENKSVLTVCNIPQTLHSIKKVVSSSYHTILIGTNAKNEPVIAGAGEHIQEHLGVEDNQSTTGFITCPCPPGMVGLIDVKTTIYYRNRTLLIGYDNDNKPLLALSDRNERGFKLLTLPKEIIALKEVHMDYRMIALLAYTANNQTIMLVSETPFNAISRLIECSIPKEYATVSGIRLCGDESLLIFGVDSLNQPLVMGKGGNPNGQLGLGEITLAKEFTACVLPPALRSIQDVQTAFYCTVLAGTDREKKPLVLATGMNAFHMNLLGTGDTGSKNLFTLCPLPPELFKIKTLSRSSATFITGIDREHRPLFISTDQHENNAFSHNAPRNCHLLTYSLPKPITHCLSFHTQDYHRLLTVFDGQNKPEILVAGINSYGELALDKKHDESVTAFITIQPLHYQKNEKGLYTFFHPVNTENNPVRKRKFEDPYCI